MAGTSFVMAITPIACGAERSNILEERSGSSPFKHVIQRLIRMPPAVSVVRAGQAVGLR
jgi:hypothetical protein